jgi:hypothetical protein
MCLVSHILPCRAWYYQSKPDLASYTESHHDAPYLVTSNQPLMPNLATLSPATSSRT